MGCSLTTEEELYPEVPLYLMIGETKIINLEVRETLTKNLRNIAGWQGFFTARVSVEDTVATIKKRTTNAGGSDAQALILDQNVSLGLWQVYLVYEDSYLLDYKKGPLRWDAWVVSPTGETKPIVRNSPLFLRPSITRF